MRDALRLSRAMTYKSAVAGLPLGGGKGVIMLPDGPPHGRDRTATLLDFADTVAALDGSYITAEDVGTSARDMTVIARGHRRTSPASRARAAARATPVPTPRSASRPPCWPRSSGPSGARR